MSAVIKPQGSGHKCWMRFGWVWLTLVSAVAGCVNGAPTTDGPVGPIDATADAAHADAQHTDGSHADASQPDAVPPDASPPLPLIPTGANLGLVEAGVAGTGSVRFDNNSGAD